MADLQPYNDPYAVPPLPHMDPNQPYRDDPTGQNQFYDPYRGPVPHSLHDPSGSVEGSESIPMSTYHPSSGAYGGATNVTSPPPGSVATGRQSPGQAYAYGSGRQSPGAAFAYGSGRQSPGPNAATQNYPGYTGQ